MTVKPSTYYDRRVQPALLDALKPGRPMHSLIERRNLDRHTLDVQLRALPGRTPSWASLYVGLTSVLDVVVGAGERFSLRAHATHRRAGGFDPAWSKARPLAEVEAEWAAVDDYLRRAILKVDSRHIAREGVVHAALCSGSGSGYRVVDREAVVGFDRDKESICAEFRDRIVKALAAADAMDRWWPGPARPLGNLGTGLDILAVDDRGRLLVIEAKPADAPAGIALAPIQVRFYAELFSRWCREHVNAREILDGMLRQRIELGLSGAGPSRFTALPVVVPVVAIGAGEVSPTARSRFHQIADCLADQPTVEAGIDPLEVWRLDEHGGRIRP